jgi:hypothetical protein
LTESIGVILSEETPAAGNLRKKNDHAAYGHYYQWGRNDDGHEGRTKTGTSSTLATDITDAGTNLFITSTNDWASVDV